MNRDLTWLHLLARQQLVNYPAAFTVWQEHYRTLLKEQDIQIYNRWYSTDCYQLQEPLDSILELILTQGGTAKITVADDQNPVRRHNHAANNSRTSSWALTVAWPLDNPTQTFDLITEYNDQRTRQTCSGPTTLWFNSTEILHSAHHCRGRWIFLIYDFQGPKYLAPAVIGSLRDRTDFEQLLLEKMNDPEYQTQILPEFPRLLELARLQTRSELDWRPTNRPKYPAVALLDS